jgi:hypothetical protein
MAFDQTLERNTTSKIIEVMMRDSTTGQGLTGINGVNAVASYVIEGATSVQYTLANGLPGAVYTSGVWAEVDSTNMPGIYQLHVPNAAFATTAASVTLTIKYAGALDKVIRVCLLAVDLRDSASLGLTNLDAAVSSRSTVSATDIVTGGAINTAAGAVSNVTTVATCSANSDMRGTNGALLAISAPPNFTSLAIDVSGTVTAGNMRGTDSALLAASAPTNFGDLSITATDGYVTLADTSLAKFITFNTGETSATTGSVAALAQGSAGGDVTVGDITQTALAKFANTDTGETSATSGSVAQLSQGSAGGNVTVGAMTAAALAQFATLALSSPTVDPASLVSILRSENEISDLTQAALAKFANTDTGETTAATGSVAKLSQGGGGGSVTVGGFDLAALQALVQTDTTLTAASSGSVAALSQSTPLDAAGTASAVWDALYASYKAAGTFGKLMDQLRKSNLSVDGTVTNTTTPTASAFDSGITGYVDEAFDNALLLFVSGSLEGESRAILSFVQANGRVTFEESFSQIPQPGDEFVILPAHIHPISQIQSGLARTTDLATVIKTGQQYTATAQSGDTINVTIS